MSKLIISVPAGTSRQFLFQAGGQHQPLGDVVGPGETIEVDLDDIETLEISKVGRSLKRVSQ